MTTHARILTLVATLALGAGCHGGATSLLTPRPGVPTTTPTPGPTLSATQVNAALQSTQTFYLTLPHRNPAADIASVAAEMVSSGNYKAAVVTPGGITATLPDGSLAMVFADSAQDLGIAPAVHARSTSSVRALKSAPIGPGITSQPNGHEIAFMVNGGDPVTFDPRIQQKFASAFLNDNSGTGQPTYGVDFLGVDIDKIVSLGQGRTFDLLDITTHGMVVQNGPLSSPSSPPTYSLGLLSTTAVTAASKLQYAADLAAHRVAYAVNLSVDGGLTTMGTFAFTPDFLTENLHFNPGAIVDLEACWSHNPLISSAVATTLGNAGAGEYIGWTKATLNSDSFASQGFLFDRLLGEQSPSTTGLDGSAPQRTPPQRPFPLSQIAPVMQATIRSNSPLESSKPYTYIVSDYGYAPNGAAPPTADGTAAFLVFSSLPQSQTSTLVEYAFPSIERLEVAEGLMGGTLTIRGAFPAAMGTAQITDAAGPHALTPTEWTADHVTVALPAGGDGSAGNVQVFSTEGFGSNIVPLTQWQGTVTYSESDTIAMLGGVTGDGPGSLQVVFNLTFRSDVHPTVPTIETTPVPQNLYFQNVEGNSTAAVTALTGHFTSSQGTPPPATADLALVAAPTMVPTSEPVGAPITGTFVVGAFAGQPSPCNNAKPGPEGDAGNVFCPGFGYVPGNAGSCTADVDDPSLCAGAATFSPNGSFGAAGLTDPALVLLTMDSSYNITISGQSAPFTRPFRGSRWPATAVVTGTVGPPHFAPNNNTPASRARKRI